MNPTLLDYIAASVAARAGGGYRPRSRTQGAPTSSSPIWTEGPANIVNAVPQAENLPGSMDQAELIDSLAWQAAYQQDNWGANNMNKFVEKPVFWWQK